jgi:hypothetical protein
MRLPSAVIGLFELLDVSATTLTSMAGHVVRWASNLLQPIKKISNSIRFI